MSKESERAMRERYGPPVSRAVNRPTFQRGYEFDCTDFKSWFKGVDVFPELVGVKPFAPVVGAVGCCRHHPNARVVTGAVVFPGFGVYTASATDSPDHDPKAATCTSTLDPEFAARVMSCAWGEPGLLGHLGAAVAGEVMTDFARRVLGAMAATVYAVHPEWTGGENPGMDGVLKWWDFDDNGVAVECRWASIDVRTVVY